MDPYSTWIGMGVKGGGFLGVVGGTTFNGMATRLDGVASGSPTFRGFNVTELQFGIGLGGNVGPSLFLATNTGMLEWIVDTTSGWTPTAAFAMPDVDVNTNEASFAPGFVNVVIGTINGAGSDAVKILSSTHGTDLLGWTTALYNTVVGNVGYTPTQPWWTVIDSPAGGAGAQAMLGMTNGSFGLW